MTSYDIFGIIISEVRDEKTLLKKRKGIDDKMRIKMKYNQPREKLIFTVKELTDVYSHMIDDTIDDDTFYYIQDVNIATAQNNHNNLIEALNGLRDAIDASKDKNIKLFNIINKLIDMIG